MHPSMMAPMPPLPLKKVSIISPKTPLAMSHGIDDDNVARLSVIEGVAMQLSFGSSILRVRVQVLPLGHELQRQGGADHRLPRSPGDRASDLRVPNTEAAELAAGRGAADTG